jgi:Na+-translocating ferredoxin:NAD+ oxidoreductase RnfG subunit
MPLRAARKPVRTARFARTLAVAAAVAAGLALGAGAAPGPASARVYLTREAALAQVFGADARIEARNVFLTAEQVTRIEQAAGARLASARVTQYVASRGDSLLGTAYLDTHLVRTMMETVLITVRPDGRVGTVEVLSFHEPEDYLAPARWLDRFDGQALSRDLKPGQAVPNLGGATLTARAVSAAVRRTLALHATLSAGGER